MLNGCLAAPDHQALDNRSMYYNEKRADCKRLRENWSSITLARRDSARRALVVPSPLALDSSQIHPGFALELVLER